MMTAKSVNNTAIANEQLSFLHDVAIVTALTNMAECWAEMPGRYHDAKSLLTPILQIILPKVAELREKDIAKARRLVEVAAHLVVSTLIASDIDIDERSLAHRLNADACIK